MSMDINEFKNKFTKEQLEGVISCKNMKEVFAYISSEKIQLEEDDENILASVFGEKKTRPEGDVSVDGAFLDRFRVFSEKCDAYKERTYLSDDVWEAGYDPRTGPRVIKDHICMNCDNARVKQYYCFCTAGQ